MDFIYKRKAYYHETDQMGVIHHSNYFRWLEEARIELMIKIGLPYELMEKRGIISPIIDASAKYIKPISFADTAYISLNIVKYNGVKLEIEYEIKNQNGDLCVKANTTSCFVKDNNVVSLKREYVEFDEAFRRFKDEANSIEK